MTEAQKPAEQDELLAGAEEQEAPAAEEQEAPAKDKGKKAAAPKEDLDKGLKECDARAMQLWRSGAFGWDNLQAKRIRDAGYSAKSVRAAAKAATK